MVARSLCGVAQRHNFCVAGRVAVGQRPVVALPEYSTVLDDDRTHGYF
jgi:hypothetical protein